MNELKKITRILLIVTVLTVALSIIGCKKECKHDYSDNVVPPTCLEDGYTEHTCSKCGDSYRDSATAKVDHTYVAEHVSATCAAEGYTKHTCSDCGNTYNDSFIPVTAHRFNGGDCLGCGKANITENITPDTEWYSADLIIFTINTKEQLAGLASLVNSGTDFTNQKIYLDADLDLEYAEWIPIGTAEYAFTGTFAGEGHTISNLKITATTDYIGLFGRVSGSISNFTVYNASVYAKNDQTHISIACGYSANMISDVNVSGGYLDAEKSNCVGAVAGETEAQVESCSNSVEVNGNDYVGGIFGSSNVASAIYTDLTNSAEVSGNDYVGGLAGYINGSGSVHTDILSNTASVTGAHQVGGIVGYISAKVGSAIYGASVSANISGEYYVGGIVGQANNVAVSTCTNDGTTVSANLYFTEGDNFYVYLGGFVGAGYSVDNCVNNTDITYNSRGAYVGGIAGYLASSASNCENNGNISAYSGVGGVVGTLNTTSALNLSSLKNNGNISGNNRVGGIMGCYISSANTTISDLENTGNISAIANRVAGIIGYHDNGNATLNAAYLKNSGDITSETLDVGGLFGYVIGSTSSVIKNSVSSASVSGKYKVGGLVGVTNTVTLKDCSNEGSTITATGWFTEGDIDYVWLGGYVGLGYKISGCTNNSDINYDGMGIYVGGIVGYATNDITDCTNNGNITTKTNCVGGIAGEANSTTARTFSNLTNTGNISGNSRVGGVIGCLYQLTNQRGQLYNNNDKYHQYFRFTTVLSNVNNFGSVSGTDCVGGIVGYTYVESTYYTYEALGAWIKAYSDFVVKSSNLNNYGLISTANKCGEIYGYFYSDNPYYSNNGVSDIMSTLTTYTVTGKIIVNGEVKEGTYDVGSKTNLTLSGRVVYVPEVTEGDDTSIEE